jgi:hypothetical protein
LPEIPLSLETLLPYGNNFIKNEEYNTIIKNENKKNIESVLYGLECIPTKICYVCKKKFINLHKYRIEERKFECLDSHVEGYVSYVLRLIIENRKCGLCLQKNKPII